jgi:hypothetical protein
MWGITLGFKYLNPASQSSALYFFLSAQISYIESDMFAVWEYKKEEPGARVRGPNIACAL